MTEHLAEHFVHLRHGRFGAHGRAELRLNHRKRTLHVGPLMVALQKFAPVELVEVPQLAPEFRTFPSCVALERNVGRGSSVRNRLQVCLAEVALVGGNLRDLKALRSRVKQRRQVRVIVGIGTSYFDTRNYVSLDPDHQVGLDPLVPAPHLSILLVIPANEGASRESRTVPGEGAFYGLQRACAFLYECFQDRSQSRIFEIVKHAVVVWCMIDLAIRGAFSQITCRTSAGHGSVNLHHGAKDNIGEQEPGATSTLWGLRDAVAKSAQEFCDMFFLVALGSIVRRPILGVGDTHGLSDRGSSVRASLTPDAELDGVNMLALDSSRLMVGTGTRRDIAAQIDGVYVALARLRRDNPDRTLSAQLHRGGDFQSSLFACVHDHHLHVWPQCSYTVARCQGHTLTLTCSYKRATLWLMAKRKRKARLPTVKPLKDDVVRMRISGTQKQALTEAAEREGLELSAWLRQLALRAAGVLSESK